MKLIRNNFQYISLDEIIVSTRFRRHLMGAIGGMGMGAMGSYMGGGGGSPDRSPSINSHDPSVTALYYSLDNIVGPEVAAEHPDWSSAQVRAEAVNRMEVRNSYHVLHGYMPELNGQAVVTTEWKTIETPEGPRLATWEGNRYQTQQGTWENFEKYAKSRGDWTPVFEAEKNAQLTMERAMISGDAKTAATWLSHESGMVRLLQVWEKSDDGRVVSRQYDIRHIVGRDITPKEAEQVMQHVGKLYGEKVAQADVAYPHVVTKDTIRIQDVATVTRGQIVFAQENKPQPVRRYQHQSDESKFSAPREVLFAIDPQVKDLPDRERFFATKPSIKTDKMIHQNGSNDVIKPTVDQALHIGSRTLAEVKATAVVAGAFVLSEIQKRRREQKNNKQSLVGRIRTFLRRREGKQLAIFSREKKAKSMEIFSQETTFRTLKKKTIETVGKVKKEVFHFIHQKYQEMKGIKTVIAFAAQSGVGIGVALLGLRVMSQEFPKSIRKILGKIEKKKTTGEGKDVKIKRRKITGLFFRGKQDRKEMASPISLLVKEIKKRTEKMKNEKSAERIFSPKKEQRLIKRREKQLMGALSHVLKLLENNAPKKEQKKPLVLNKKKLEAKPVIEVKQTNPRRELRKQRKLERREATLQFSFAWILWMLLSGNKKTHIAVHDFAFRRHAGLSSIHPERFWIPRRFGTRMTNRDVVSRNDKEFYAPIQSTPWILLSIIWYLNMIREMGMQQTPASAVQSGTTTGQTQKNSSVQQIPSGYIGDDSMMQQGVIFAFGS